MLMTACASTEKFIRQMDQQIGQPLSSVQKSFGYNFVKRTLKDGQTAYTWSWLQRDLSPGYRSPDIIQTWKSKKGLHTYIIPGMYFPPEYYEYACELTFIINSDERVIAWRAHGNGCAYYPGPEDVLTSK